MLRIRFLLHVCTHTGHGVHKVLSMEELLLKSQKYELEVLCKGSQQRYLISVLVNTSEDWASFVSAWLWVFQWRIATLPSKKCTRIAQWETSKSNILQTTVRFSVLTSLIYVFSSPLQCFQAECKAAEGLYCPSCSLGGCTPVVVWAIPANACMYWTRNISGARLGNGLQEGAEVALCNIFFLSWDPSSRHQWGKREMNKR